MKLAEVDLINAVVATVVVYTIKLSLGVFILNFIVSLFFEPE